MHIMLLVSYMSWHTWQFYQQSILMALLLRRSSYLCAPVDTKNKGFLCMHGEAGQESGSYLRHDFCLLLHSATSRRQGGLDSICPSFLLSWVARLLINLSIVPAPLSSNAFIAQQDSLKRKSLSISTFPEFQCLKCQLAGMTSTNGFTRDIPWRTSRWTKLSEVMAVRIHTSFIHTVGRSSDHYLHSNIIQ